MRDIDAAATRARVRREAGWSPALVSALDILEYGCDYGDYDEEVAAVLKLVDALQQIRDRDWVENALNPQWAAQLARRVLDGTEERAA